MHAPAAVDRIEQRYLRDLWRATDVEIGAEQQLDVVKFGPVQATVVGEEPEDPLLNVVLGASADGAVAGGHLADAIDWVEAHGLDYRVPVTPDRPESNAGERWLMERGHEQGSTWLKFARDASPSGLEEPTDVEVWELDNEADVCETFMHLDDDSFWGARWLGSCFSEVAERREWRCYVAYGGESGRRSSGAVMLLGGSSAEVGALLSGGEGDAALHGALLRRCVRDAATAGCEAVFAEAEASESGDDRSSAAETLLAAGFHPVFKRTDWRPPRRAGRYGSVAMPEEGLEPPTRGL